MTIFLNGEERDVADATTIDGLIAEMGFPASAVLVEHNGLALRREEWIGACLAPGDRVELLRIVAGG